MAGAAPLPGRVENSIDAVQLHCQPCTPARATPAPQPSQGRIEDAEVTCEPQRQHRTAPLAFLLGHAVPSAGNPEGRERAGGDTAAAGCAVTYAPARPTLLQPRTQHTTQGVRWLHAGRPASDQDAVFPSRSTVPAAPRTSARDSGDYFWSMAGSVVRWGSPAHAGIDLTL